MNGTLVKIVALGLPLISIGWCWAAEPPAERTKSIAEIEKIGGRVAVNEKSPAKPVDVDLSRLTVTDALLKHLQGIANLERLLLDHTSVTDAGLAHLEGLTDLRMLSLMNTAVTDAGLVHLKGLINLQALYLQDTQVTKPGVAGLCEALPMCKIFKVEK